MEKESAGTMSLASAYSECRVIARREAKNFYYAFVALPESRRNAICAIYAFMRQADDLADDESLSRADRRVQLDTWLCAWHAASKGEETIDPVFLAVKDAMERFGIPGALLDELVAGVTMDLEAGESAEPVTYATFDELYRYCYLVASVVGLVCIRIFGYSDKRAEKLAEETGIAFQLTNILRDVAEDAERKRVYLPLDMLARHGVTVEGLLGRAAGAAASAWVQRLIACGLRESRSRRRKLAPPARPLALRARPMRADFGSFWRSVAMGLPMRSSTACFRNAVLSSWLPIPRKHRVWMTISRPLDSFRWARAIRFCGILRRDRPAQKA